MKYVALLRGINVGNKKVAMLDLKKVLKELGFTDIKTLLNSGNVLFSSDEQDSSFVTEIIAQRLEETFGFAIPVLVRTQRELQALVASDPFKNIQVTPETRLYITFLSEDPKSNLPIPYESKDNDLCILSVSHRTICTVIILSPKFGTVDMMSFIEKKFGRNVTTRNWNTVIKLAAL